MYTEFNRDSSELLIQGETKQDLGKPATQHFAIIPLLTPPFYTLRLAHVETHSCGIRSTIPCDKGFMDHGNADLADKVWMEARVSLFVHGYQSGPGADSGQEIPDLG